jgi:hypothetical protein
MVSLHSIDRNVNSWHFHDGSEERAAGLLAWHHVEREASHCRLNSLAAIPTTCLVTFNWDQL